MTFNNNINIFLVRHGESEGNVDMKAHQKKINRMIQLTKRGKKQAQLTGNFLSENYNINKENTLMISSSFKRAEQTADNMNISLKLKNYLDDRLVERNHGVFEGLTKKECFQQFPKEAEYYFKQNKSKNYYFTKALMGESPVDVSIRFQLFWNDLLKDIKQQSLLENVILVAHGITNLVIQKYLGEYNVEWYEEQRPNPNCSIVQFIVNRQSNKIIDCGLIFQP